MNRKWMLALVVVALASVYPLAELTQNRPDKVPDDSTTVVEYEVMTRGYDEDLAAVGLWATCQQTIDHARSDGLPELVGERRYSVVVSPGLGEHARRRLEGCLEDATIDRVSATVTRFELIRPPAA
jgi:hypothetical protein